MNEKKKIRREILKFSGMIGIASVMLGCVTRSLFEAHQYGEKISSVLISKDGKELVVIGENYHYVFDAPNVLIKSLTSGFHKSVSANIGEFRVDGTGNVTGKASLIVSIKAPEQDKLAAIEAGYKKFTFADQQYGSSYELKLAGIRYKSNGIQPSLATQRLNTSYTVSVVAEQSSGEKAAKALLTPVTVATDGILFIGAIPLILLGAISTVAIVEVHCHDKPDCLK